MAIIKVITPSVTDDSITLAKMASGTDGNIISYDASGNPVAVATGNDGQVLTSTGAGSPPVFETPAGGANTPAFAVKLSGDQNISNDETFTKITFDSEDLDSDGKFASNRFTPTVAGWYNIQLQVFVQGDNAQMNIGLGAIYKNGSKVVEARVDYRTNRGRGAGVHAGYVLYLDSDDYIEGFAANNDNGSSQAKIKAQPGTLMSGFRITGV